jgi:hypothetical protein
VGDAVYRKIHEPAKPKRPSTTPIPFKYSDERFG